MCKIRCCEWYIKWVNTVALGRLLYSKVDAYIPSTCLGVVGVEKRDQSLWVWTRLEIIFVIDFKEWVEFDSARIVNNIPGNSFEK